MTLFIIFAAKYLFILPILLLIYIWIASDPHVRFLITMRAAISLVIALVLIRVAEHYIVETRPYMTGAVSSLISNPPTDNSFPSDHTTLSFSTTLLILPFSWPLALISFLASIVVAYGRIAAHLHYIKDIWGGIGIALVSTGVAYLFFPGARKEGKDS